MRVIYYLIAILFLPNLCAYSQNVGIGTTTPTERLDVNGNLNVSGNLKVNGNAGANGQFLSVDNSGQQYWASLQQSYAFKNRVEFIIPGTNTFTVPAGVHVVLIEITGGGGGGSISGGGGGGGYLMAICKVDPGQTVTLYVATGGQGANTSTSNGGNGSPGTAVLTNSFNLYAAGGFGALTTGTGVGGTCQSGGDSLVVSKGVTGGIGKPTTENYSQQSATVFATSRFYGSGGICSYNPDNINPGAFLSYNTATQLNITLNTIPYLSNSYGSGGGGGNTSGGTWGQGGGSGIIAISY